MPFNWLVATQGSSVMGADRVNLQAYLGARLEHAAQQMDTLREQRDELQDAMTELQDLITYVERDLEVRGAAEAAE